MKKVYTKAGDIYAVSCANGCTITADGTTLCTVEAGKQSTFVAISNSVEVSDDTALVTFVKPSKDGRKILPIVGEKKKIDFGDVDCYIYYNDGKLTVRQPDGFMITPSCLSETQTGRNRAWAYNISPDITHIDGGGVLKPPANSGFFFTYLTNLKSIAGVDYSQVIKPGFMFAATGLESFDVCLPNATSGYGIFSGDSKLNTVRLIIPLTKNLRECFYSAPALRYVTLHAGMCTALDFQNVYADSAIGAMPLLESLEFESYNGTPALASCTTFKLYATHTKLTDQSISNCVEAFTDWSSTGKSATCQFPAGRLTEEQKATLTAKGWTYTEV